jgi:hypothetical protein
LATARPHLIPAVPRAGLERPDNLASKTGYRSETGEGNIQGVNPTFSPRQKIKSKIREGLILAVLFLGFVLPGQFLHLSEPRFPYLSHWMLIITPNQMNCCED